MLLPTFTFTFTWTFLFIMVQLSIPSTHAQTVNTNTINADAQIMQFFMNSSTDLNLGSLDVSGIPNNNTNNENNVQNSGNTTNNESTTRQNTSTTISTLSNLLIYATNVSAGNSILASLNLSSFWTQGESASSSLSNSSIIFIEAVYNSTLLRRDAAFSILMLGNNGTDIYPDFIPPIDYRPLNIQNSFDDDLDAYMSRRWYAFVSGDPQVTGKDTPYNIRLKNVYLDERYYNPMDVVLRITSNESLACPTGPSLFLAKDYAAATNNSIISAPPVCSGRGSCIDRQCRCFNQTRYGGFACEAEILDLPTFTYVNNKIQPSPVPITIKPNQYAYYWFDVPRVGNVVAHISIQKPPKGYSAASGRPILIFKRPYEAGGDFELNDPQFSGDFLPTTYDTDFQDLTAQYEGYDYQFVVRVNMSETDVLIVGIFNSISYNKSVEPLSVQVNLTTIICGGKGEVKCPVYSSSNTFNFGYLLLPLFIGGVILTVTASVAIIIQRRRARGYRSPVRTEKLSAAQIEDQFPAFKYVALPTSRQTLASPPPAAATATAAVVPPTASRNSDGSMAVTTTAPTSGTSPSGASPHEEDEQCAICLCEFETDEMVRKLPCKHQFHSECLDPWIAANDSCPFCRSCIRTTGSDKKSLIRLRDWTLSPFHRLARSPRSPRTENRAASPVTSTSTIAAAPAAGTGASVGADTGLNNSQSVNNENATYTVNVDLLPTENETGDSTSAPHDRIGPVGNQQVDGYERRRETV
eukprot:CAMPEP_0184694178 /NCGR_PEP_ID=MMETSP0313-20130426/2217_1 /TAXON_ID=2792 /ORGANISM="Porphyridium aerugineum, Strain SAG 1380-2" /LENGTH=751 /DNA_ID=CAMNT_0027152419 /DNA_START=610 /DNA_END=2865 /DNA_ORIENTATION=+